MSHCFNDYKTFVSFFAQVFVTEATIMNITSSLDVGGGEDLGFGGGVAFEDGSEATNGTLAKNLTNIWFSMKSNNSELADCSQNILMDEIKVSFVLVCFLFDF